MLNRQLSEPVKNDLKHKMVFISGPRQVGKTTLARKILRELSPRLKQYLNWDRPEHRKTIRDLSWNRKAPLVVLDEVHKYGRWKTLLKGFYDTEGSKQTLLVTGSARMDIYRRGGESLFGRYTGYRMHPFSIGELARNGRCQAEEVLLNPAAWSGHATASRKGLAEALLSRGGFPEPFLSSNEREVRRWRLSRRDLVLRQELRDLTMIRNVGMVEHLMELLRERVGSTLSIQSLSEDLQADFKTVESWIGALEKLYLVFRVRPYSGGLARTFRKEGKVYFWDWSETPAGGARFENFVASHLLKFCDWMRDVEGYEMDLRFIRDREKREVDFLVLKEGRPWFLAEAKYTAENRHAPLHYFQERLKVPHGFQIFLKGTDSPGRISAGHFFSLLP
jgi:predicted AAA+ superfamily ATPase